jgi:hypothetical protein
MRGQVIVGAVVALLAFTAPAGAQLPVGGGQNPPVPIPVPSGAPAAEPYGTNDYGGFRDVLPPGTNGLDNGGQLAAFLATGRRPAHNDDQLAMYRDLMYATPGLQAQDIGRFYKDSTFGVKPDDVESTISPRSDVTIVRDKGFGVPHIYGSTHAGVMFGAAESILLGFSSLASVLLFITMPGLIDSYPPATQEILRTQFSLAFIPVPIWERLFTTISHVFVTALALYALRAGGKWLALSAAIGVLIDGSIFWVAYFIPSSSIAYTVVLEAIVGFIGAISLYGLFWLRARYDTHVLEA